MADLFGRDQSDEVIETRVNRRFPKVRLTPGPMPTPLKGGSETQTRQVSPLAASEGLALQCGLVYTPPGHPSLRTLSEGECVRLDHLEKVRAYSYGRCDP